MNTCFAVDRVVEEIANLLHQFRTKDHAGVMFCKYCLKIEASLRVRVLGNELIAGVIIEYVGSIVWLWRAYMTDRVRYYKTEQLRR